MLSGRTGDPRGDSGCGGCGGCTGHFGHSEHPGSGRIVDIGRIGRIAIAVGNRMGHRRARRTPRRIRPRTRPFPGLHRPGLRIRGQILPDRALRARKRLPLRAARPGRHVGRNMADVGMADARGSHPLRTRRRTRRRVHAACRPCRLLQALPAAGQGERQPTGRDLPARRPGGSDRTPAPLRVAGAAHRHPLAQGRLPRGDSAAAGDSASPRDAAQGRQRGDRHRAGGFVDSLRPHCARRAFRHRSERSRGALCPGCGSGALRAGA